jgi:hypothetical protein
MSMTRDDSWNQTHYLLHVAGEWFKTWDRHAAGGWYSSNAPSPGQQFESLNGILTEVGLVTPDLSKRHESLPPGDYARIPYKAVADRYNGFLTNHEALLRRLPQDVGLLDPPPLSGECFSVRL